MASVGDDPYLERIRRGLRREQAEEPTPTSFSSLELRDRVVIMLLFDQVVRIEQVERVWHAHGEEERDGSFWRALAEDPEIDRVAVFEKAAQVYGFERTNVSKYQVLDFIRKHRDAFSAEQWRALVERALVPATLEYEGGGAQQRWVFVTHDPAHSSVARLLGSLGLRRHVVRYLPEGALHELLQEVFPQWTAPTTPVQEKQSAPTPTVEEQSAQEQPAAQASSLLGLFEDILVQMMQREADAVRLQPDEEQRLAVRFRLGGREEPWRRGEHVAASAFLAFIKEEIFGRSRMDQAERTEVVLQRWIDGERARFHLTLHRSEERRDSRRTEAVVIRRIEN